MNGDLLTTIDFSAMLRFHRAHGKIATLGVADKKVKIDLGVIETSSDGQLINYIEKPQMNYKISMGIYVFEPAVLNYISGSGRIDLPDLLLKLVKDRQPPVAFDSNCEWLDIGRTEDYAAASTEFETNRALYLWEKQP